MSEEKISRRKYLYAAGAVAAGAAAVGGAAYVLTQPGPTPSPTVAPTATPTVAPTATPTVAPTATPTVAPTATPVTPWIGDQLSAPEDPGWHRYPRVNPPYKIACLGAWTGNPWRVICDSETKLVLDGYKDIGWVEDWVLMDAGGDAMLQKRQMADAVSWGADAITIDPTSADALVPDIEATQKQGIFVASNNENPLPSTITYVGTIVGTNYYKYGEAGAKFVAERLIAKYPKEKRQIANIRGIAGAPSNISRAEGCQHGVAQYADQGVQLVASTDSNWSSSKAREDAADVLAAHPDVRGWVTQGAAMLPGIVGAILDAKQDPAEHIITDEDVVIDLKLHWQYNFDFLCTVNPPAQRTWSIWEILKALYGCPVRKIAFYDPPIISSEDELHGIWIDGLPDAAYLLTHMTADQLKEYVKA